MSHMYMPKDEDNKSSSFALIDGDSTLNVAGMDNFGNKAKLEGPYRVISIMGPQSSGKSTLLNHLFGTTFRELDALKMRGRTTQGIWLAKSPNVKSCTLIMDLEGSDGRERGEDGTKFEKQAALFAFAVSDIVLINMWSNSIGCVQAASIPLLRTVFEAMKKLKLRESETTLWFVLRDKSPKVPIEILEGGLRKDIQRIWESVEKETSTSETFEVKIKGLSNYEYKKEEFVDEVANLKEQLLGELAENGRDEHPASGFCFGVKQLWEMIKDNKDLDLPAHKIMVATVRCEDIANNTFASLVENKVWRQLESNVQSVPVKDFGKGLRDILDEHLSGYDMKTKYYDEDIRTQKRRQLKDTMLQHVEPAHQTMLERIHSRTLNEFKEAFPKEFKGEQLFRNAVCDYTKQFMTKFDEECRDAATNQENWGAFKLRSSLQHDIKANVSKVHSDAMSEYLKHDKKKLEKLLSGRVENLLDKAADGTWKEIRDILRETHSSFRESSTDIDKHIKDKNLKELNEYARHIIHEKSRQEATIVQTQMVKRFEKCFTHDNSNIRLWTGKEDIKEMDKNGRIAALKRLSIMAAIRLDDDADDIEKTLFSAFIDLDVSANDSLDSPTWAKVPPGKTLIKPVECKNCWENFNKSSELIVHNASVIRKGIANGTLAKNVALTAGGIVAGATAVAGVVTAVTIASPVTGIAAGITGVVGLVATTTEVIKQCREQNKTKK